MSPKVSWEVMTVTKKSEGLKNGQAGLGKFVGENPLHGRYFTHLVNRVDYRHALPIFHITST